MLCCAVLDPCSGLLGVVAWLAKATSCMLLLSTNQPKSITGGGWLQLKVAKQHLTRLANESGQQRFTPADLDAFLASLPDMRTDSAPEDPQGSGVDPASGSDLEVGGGGGVRQRQMGDVSFVPEERRGGVRQKGLSRATRAVLKGKQRRMSPGQTYCASFIVVSHQSPLFSILTSRNGDRSCWTSRCRWYSRGGFSAAPVGTISLHVFVLHKGQQFKQDIASLRCPVLRCLCCPHAARLALLGGQHTARVARDFNAGSTVWSMLYLPTFTSCITFVFMLNEIGVNTAWGCSATPSPILFSPVCAAAYKCQSSTCFSSMRGQDFVAFKRK